MRRHRLLDAALRLFAERGYHETTVDEVVAEARTSKSAFYEFFESKDDCCRQLLEDRGGRLIKTVVEAALTGADHRARIRRGIEAFLSECAREGQLARLLLVESVGLSPRIEEVRHRLHGRFAAVVEGEIKEAAGDDPFYAAVDPGVFARALVGAVNEVTGQLLGTQGVSPVAAAEGLGRIFAP